MWAATIGFVLVGLVLLIAGRDAEARTTGAASMAFFGLGGGLYLWITRPREAPVPELEVARTDLLGVSEAGLAIRVRPPVSTALSFGFLLALSAGLTVLGIRDGDVVYTVLGVGSGVLWLYAGAAFVRRRSTRSRVLLTASGFVFEHPVSSLGVRWADVEGLSLFTQGKHEFVGIDAPQEAVVQRTGSRVLMRLNRAVSGAAISVPALGLAADPERLLDALDAYIEDPTPLRDPERERPALLARLDATAVPALP